MKNELPEHCHCGRSFAETSRVHVPPLGYMCAYCLHRLAKDRDDDVKEKTHG